jgi:hypothetical protein
MDAILFVLFCGYVGGVISTAFLLHYIFGGWTKRNRKD